MKREDEEEEVENISRCGICADSYAINKKRRTRHGELIDDSDGETDTASLCVLCS